MNFKGGAGSVPAPFQPLTLRHAVGFAAPHTWAASVFPALLGILLSYSLAEAAEPLLSLALLAAAVLMQAAVNTLNDYHDFLRGTDTVANSDDPSDAVLVYNRLNPRHVRALGAGFLGAALALGCYCVYRGGLAPLFIGGVGAVTVVCYSSGRLPISFLPLGEAVSGFVMGALIPMGCYGAYTGRVSGRVLILSLPMVLGIGLIMMTNNASDLERDAATRRRTLPILLGGREATRRLYRGLELAWAASAVLPVALWFPRGLAGLALVLLPTLPVLRRMWGLALTPETRGMSMGTIIKANMGVHGAYLAGILLHTLR